MHTSYLQSNEIKGKQQKKQEQTLIKIDEEGAVFRSYVDGLIHHLSPERSMVIQKQLGADLIVVRRQIVRQGVQLNQLQGK